jgi:hypothetical protein
MLSPSLCPESTQAAWNRFYWKNSLIPMPLAYPAGPGNRISRERGLFATLAIFARNFRFLSRPDCGGGSSPDAAAGRYCAARRHSAFIARRRRA